MKTQTKTTQRLDWTIQNLGLWVATYKDATRLVARTQAQLMSKINKYEQTL